MTNIFKLNIKDIAGAVVSAVLSAILVYISNLADLSSFDFHQLLGIAIIVGASSLLKALSTNSTGKFIGAIKVK